MFRGGGQLGDFQDFFNHSGPCSEKNALATVM